MSKEFTLLVNIIKNKKAINKLFFINFLTKFIALKK